MNILIKTLLLISLALAPWLAQAKIFMCKDATGRTITSDRPIPECADRAVKELGNDGVARREVARPPTPEEIRQRKADEEQRKIDAAAAEVIAKNDRLLMARYPSEKDLETARKRSADQLRDQLKIESAAFGVAEKKLIQAQIDVEAAKKRPKGPPADMLRKLEEAELAVKEGKKAVKERETSLAQNDAKFDEILKRYREVNGVAPKAVAPAGAVATAPGVAPAIAPAPAPTVPPAAAPPAAAKAK